MKCPICKSERGHKPGCANKAWAAELMNALDYLDGQCQQYVADLTSACAIDEANRILIEELQDDGDMWKYNHEQLQMREANIAAQLAHAKAEIRVLKIQNGALNKEYKKTWDVLRTYNPREIELEYIGFETIEEGYVD